MRSDLGKLCPECFEPTLNGPGCKNCGFEVGELDTSPLPPHTYLGSQGTVHTIQPLQGLGSVTDYEHLGLQYGGRNISHLVQRKAKDRLLERCKSELWEELKEVMPPDWVVEEATRLLTKEVREFEAKYPSLLGSKKLTRQFVNNIVGLLIMRYPLLRLKRDSVTESGLVN